RHHRALATRPGGVLDAVARHAPMHTLFGGNQLHNLIHLTTSTLHIEERAEFNTDAHLQSVLRITHSLTRLIRLVERALHLPSVFNSPT
ncbi:MAG: hypothetical protein NZ577_03220, partial [Vicinamibacterales bacterium]|nr:hypothetical protein [Vicinamibacterales bacterium]